MTPAFSGSLASVDGAIMLASAATIPATDEGLLRGDGAFEVIRVYDGHPFAFEEHLQRLERSALNLRLPLDLEAIRADANRLLAHAGAGPDHELLRIVVTRGGRRLLLTEPFPTLPEHFRLASITYSPTRVLDGVKSLSYAANMLATRLARERGYDEALLVTPHGRVLEAPTSTLFWVEGDTLLTTPLDEHILASITRRIVIEHAGAVERACTLEQLLEADEAFLASTVREVLPVSAIDGRSFDAPGPVTTATASTVGSWIRSELAAAEMNVLTVVGNRPQFIKAAAVSAPLRSSDRELLIHTGQHFDEELSKVFFDQLSLPSPDRELGIARGSNSSQTARMLAALEPVLAEISPDAVLVYGDTNSTLAGALAGAQARVPVAHVEAGMRSFDRDMPEELNRVLADHASTLLLCSSEVAAGNLRREGVAGEVEIVGDVMVDVAMRVQPSARERLEIVTSHGLSPGDYVLATAHRAGNVDRPERLAQLVELLLAVPYPLLLALHPRTHARLRAAGFLERLQRSDRLVLTPPLGYLELTALMCNARAVLTDSGGLQKEAYLAGVPCITLRTTTEWVETVEQGWNVLVDLDLGAALQALEREPPPARPPLYGDGHAAERVVAALRLHLA